MSKQTKGTTSLSEKQLNELDHDASQVRDQSNAEITITGFLGYSTKSKSQSRIFDPKVTLKFENEIVEFKVEDASDETKKVEFKLSRDYNNQVEFGSELNVVFKSGSTAHYVVILNSPDFETVKKFIGDSLGESNVNPNSLNPREQKNNKIFQEKFFDSHDKKQALIDHLKLCNDENRAMMFAPILCLCQSSGHGKTRMMFEIAQDEFVIYICLREYGKDGYPSRSPISDDFEKSLDDIDQSWLFVRALLRAFMDTVKRLRRDRRDYQKLTAMFKETQPWLYYNNSHTNTVTPETPEQLSFKNAVMNLYRSRDESVNDITSNEWDEFVEECKVENVFIFIDEAGYLTRKITTPASEASKSIKPSLVVTRFRILRRAIQWLVQQKDIMVVLADSTTRIAQVEPNPDEITPSMKVAPLARLYPPYIDLLFVNQCVPAEYLNSLSQMTYKELVERDPTKNVFLYGRPMWSMALQRPNWLEFAKSKLDLIYSYQVTESSILSVYALLTIRTTFTLRLNMYYSSKLIADNMATLTHMNLTEQRLHLKYIQEPVLSEATAAFMEPADGIIVILKRFKYLLNMNLNMIGGIREVIAQLILLRAFDNSIRTTSSRMYSKPVTVNQFLCCLLGDEFVANGQKNGMLDAKLLQGLVCFTHFTKKLDTLLAEHVKPDFLGRCAAGHLKDNTAGFDLFIPVLLEDDTITYILVQVKNATSKQSFDNQEVSSDWFSSDNQSNKRRQDYLGIQMNLGVKDASVESILIAAETNVPLGACAMNNQISSHTESLNDTDKLEEKQDQQAEKTNQPVEQKYRFVINGISESVYNCLTKEIATLLRDIADDNRDEYSELSKSVRDSVCMDNYHYPINKKQA